MRARAEPLRAEGGPESHERPHGDTLDGQPTQVLCEMVGAVDARALGEPVGHLSLDEQRALDDALQLVLDLP